MTWKSLSLVALIIELVITICVIITVSISIKNRKSTGDYLKNTILQIVLRAILPTALIFASDYIPLESDVSIPEMVIILYSLYFLDLYNRKTKNNPPSSLKVPRELRQYYWEIQTILSTFGNCKTTYRIFDSARAYLYDASYQEVQEPSYYCEGHKNSDDKEYDHILKSDLYDKKCETWALCFILFIIDEGNYQTEKAEAIKMYAEYRLKIRCRFAPIEFLRAFRAYKFIGELYEQRLAYS